MSKLKEWFEKAMERQRFMQRLYAVFQENAKAYNVIIELLKCSLAEATELSAKLLMQTDPDFEFTPGRLMALLLKMRQWVERVITDEHFLSEVLDKVIEKVQRCPSGGSENGQVSEMRLE